MTKFKILLIAVIASAGLAASLIIQRQAQVELRENDETLRRQRIELAEMTVGTTVQQGRCGWQEILSVALPAAAVVALAALRLAGRVL